MKKTTFVTTLVVAGICATTLGGITGDAAILPVPNTKGTIEFLPPRDGGGVIKPDPDPNKPIIPIIPGPEEGGSTTGPLKINFVPNLKFGSLESTDEAIKKAAQAVQYTLSPATGTLFLPPFVQVSDFRGENYGYELKVSMSEFTTTDADSQAEKNASILGAKIMLNEATPTNNKVGNLAKISTLTASTEIPKTGEVSVLKSEANTSGSVSSAVFKAGYVENQVFDKDAQIGGAAYTGVTFEKAAKAGSPVLKGNYKADIRWVFSDGK